MPASWLCEKTPEGVQPERRKGFVGLEASAISGHSCRSHGLAKQKSWYKHKTEQRQEKWKGLDSRVLSKDVAPRPNFLPLARPPRFHHLPVRPFSGDESCNTKTFGGIFFKNLDLEKNAKLSNSLPYLQIKLVN